MSKEDKKSWEKGALKKTFSGAKHVLKELLVHSAIHFTLWGAIFASNFAAFLTPILFDPLGQGLTFLADQVGLSQLFTEAAGGGAVSLSKNPQISSLPVMGATP